MNELEPGRCYEFETENGDTFQAKIIDSGYAHPVLELDGDRRPLLDVLAGRTLKSQREISCDERVTGQAS